MTNPSSSKICSACNEEKQLSDFYTKGKSSSTGQPYFDSCCKPCAIIRATKRAKLKPQKRSREKLAIWRKNRRNNPETRHLVLWKEYRQIDRTKGRTNDLSKEDIKRFLSRRCAYCGDHTGMMTLDRIDNSLGHQSGNVIPACLRCNLVRGDMPYGAWLIIAPAMKLARETGKFNNWSPKRRG